MDSSNVDHGEFIEKYPVHVAALAGDVQMVKQAILQGIVQSVMDVQSNLLKLDPRHLGYSASHQIPTQTN